MRLGVYAVYDKQTCAYLPPFLARTDGEANRMFVEAVKNNKQFAVNAADYVLWMLSVWDDMSGVYGTMASNPDLPKRLLTGLEAVALSKGNASPERLVTQEDLGLEGPTSSGIPGDLA